jgi:hypothetical protein
LTLLGLNLEESLDIAASLTALSNMPEPAAENRAGEIRDCAGSLAQMLALDEARREAAAHADQRLDLK